MPWYAIIEKSTGRLFSTGTTLGDVDTGQYDIREYVQKIDFSTQRWNQALREFEPRPPKQLRDMRDLVEEAITDGRLGALTDTLRTDLRTVFREKLGNDRFY